MFAWHAVYFRTLLPCFENSSKNTCPLTRPSVRTVLSGLFGEQLHHHNLWHLHRRSVAGGVAVGLFTGLIPGSNPVQFFFAALFAIVFKVNLPVAV